MRAGIYNIQHFLFPCVSGGSRAARIASSNTFFSPRYEDREGGKRTAQLAPAKRDGREDKRKTAREEMHLPRIQAQGNRHVV